MGSLSITRILVSRRRPEDRSSSRREFGGGSDVCFGLSTIGRANTVVSDTGRTKRHRGLNQSEYRRSIRFKRLDIYWSGYRHPRSI